MVFKQLRDFGTSKRRELQTSLGEKICLQRRASYTIRAICR
jgi:hypothetical protein